MMITRHAVVGLAVAALSVQSLVATPASVLLEKGIYTEETVGNREQAIAIYREIVEDEKANRKYVAEALFRLGRCQAAEGDSAGALEALNRLVRQFNDQRRPVAEAKKLIARLRPSPLLPNLVGVRLRYELALDLSANDPERRAHVYVLNQTDALDISWKINEKQAELVSSFRLRLLTQPGQDASPVVLAERIDRNQRSFALNDVSKVNPLEYRLVLEAVGDDGRLIAMSSVSMKIEPAQYTQIMLDTHEASGRCGFTSIQYMLNLGQSPMTTYSFRNSDFIHVESMMDGDGKPMKFTTTHHENFNSYQAQLNKPVQPNEVFVSGSTGWAKCPHYGKGSAQGVQTYSFTHSPSTRYPTRRVEIHRLPAGAELLSTNPADLPHRVGKDGRTEVIVDKVIPPRGSLTVQLQFQLAKGDADASVKQDLQLQPAPWKDGEVVRYRLLSKAGVELGTQIWTVQEAREDGKNCWRIEQRVVVPSTDTLVLSRVLAEKESFAPVTGWTRHTIGTVSARYRPGLVRLEQEGKEGTRDVTVAGTVYDNEQVLYLMRRLPLAKGYEADFPIMSVLSGASGLECRIKVEERETVKVDSKPFDCWKIRIQVYMGAVKAVEQTAWFTVDGGHVPVKFRTDQMDLELAEQRAAPSGQMESKKHGISFRLPKGWFAYELPAVAKGFEIVRLIPPAEGPEIKLYMTLLEPADATERQLGMKDMEGLKEYYTDYTIVKAGPGRPVDGLNGFIGVAHYTKDGKAMRECRAYYAVRPHVFWWVLRTDRDSFEQQSRDLEGILKSVKFTRSSGKSGAGTNK